MASQLTGSEITIQVSRPVAENSDLPAYCQVAGTIAPSIGFEARLPLNSWNGKYLQSGCGGFCGTVVADKPGYSNAINFALRRGYAAITTDGGHQSLHVGESEWAFDNRAAEELYAHKAVPLTFEAGHRLVGTLYGDAPKISYFSGCSNGGRMAMIAAQRYPELFDGIVAGCSVIDLSRAGGLMGTWIAQSNSGEDGRPIIDHEFGSKLAFLERAVEEQCDHLDGQLDGLIMSPRNCTVDVSLITTCADNESRNDCLTAAEKRVVTAWYRGPHNSQGERLFPGMPPGGERYWRVWYTGNGEAMAPGMFLATGYGRDLGFEQDDPNYRATDFDFDIDPQRLQAMGELYNALDPDLSAFNAAGGKLIMWHALSDPLVLPDQSVSYYQNVLDGAPNDRSVQDFARLYLAPGLGHCWEMIGDGPGKIDFLSALETWVEDGQAPDAILARPDEDAIESQPTLMLQPFPRTAEFVSAE
ncbi:MAG: tannase/feruloyl esterase family alpha/beta hydrolase [Henriciella sp.]